jgi:hypothetical protein
MYVLLYYGPTQCVALLSLLAMSSTTSPSGPCSLPPSRSYSLMFPTMAAYWNGFPRDTGIQARFKEKEKEEGQPGVCYVAPAKNIVS